MATATLPQTSSGPPKKPARKDLKPGEVLCTYCEAKCCRYFALAIDTPKRPKDFEYIRWYLLHELASVFTEDETWYLLVHSPCKMLDPDNRCASYATRPAICREYSVKGCEYEDQWCYEHYLETPEQVQEYAEAVLWARHGQLRRSPKPAEPATP